MDSNKKSGWIFETLICVGCIGALACAEIIRNDVAVPNAEPAITKVATPLPESVTQVEAPASPANVPPPATVLAPAAVDRLLRDAAGSDAGARADALDALAAAPEAAAVPVLQKVLGSGDDIERQLALSSLHVLALRDGDASGAIRELLRQSVYDGGDEAVASGAQAALDDIERNDDRHAAIAPADHDR